MAAVVPVALARVGALVESSADPLDREDEKVQVLGGDAGEIGVELADITCKRHR